ncbi:MAG TPA: DUF2188 domain-containing protein [Caulobacteraceae bacterium]|nr:DUF2188 domain-containing protein [Caulobacteraceae bacterium]
MKLREYYVQPERRGGWVVKNNGFAISQSGSEAEAAETARRIAFSEWRNVKVDSQVHVYRPDGRFRTDWFFGASEPRYP